MENDRDNILNELIKYYDKEPEIPEDAPDNSLPEDNEAMEHTRVIQKNTAVPPEEKLGDTVVVKVKRKPVIPDTNVPPAKAANNAHIIDTDVNRPAPAAEEILGNLDLAGNPIDPTPTRPDTRVFESAPVQTHIQEVSPMPELQNAFISTSDDIPDEDEDISKRRDGFWFATKPLWVLIFICALFAGAVKFYITDTGIIGTYKRNFNYNMGLICNMFGIEWDFENALPVIGKAHTEPVLLAGEDDSNINSSGYVEKDNVHDSVPEIHRATGKDKSIIPFADAGNSDFSAFDKGVVCVSSDKICYITKKGKTEWSHALSITNPMVSARGKYIAVASVGGTQLQLYKNSKLVYSVDLPNNIRSCVVSENGDTVLITEKPSYKGAVVLVNNKGDIAFSWASGTNYITAITVLKNRKIGVALSGADDAVTSYVMMFDIKSTEPTSGIELKNSLIYSLTNDGRTIMANGDNCVALLNESTEAKYDKRYDDVFLTHSANDRNGYRVITYTKDNIPVMEVIDKNGDIVNSRNIEGTPDFVAINMTTVLYNNGRDVICGKAKDDKKTLYTAKKAIRKLLILDTDSYVVVYEDSIEIIRM